MFFMNYNHNYKIKYIKAWDFPFKKIKKLIDDRLQF